MNQNHNYALQKRDEIEDKRQNETLNLSKFVISLSTGAIVFSSSLISIGVNSSGFVWMLVFCWLFFVLSIIFGIKFIRNFLRELDKKAEEFNEFAMNKGLPATSKATELHNKEIPKIQKDGNMFLQLQWIFFILGLIFLSMYGFLKLIFYEVFKK